MQTAWLASMIAVPLLGAGLLFAAFRRLLVADGRARTVTLVATAGTGLCGFALLLSSRDAASLAINWFPGAGSMSLQTGATGLYTALAIVWAAFLVLLSIRSHGGLCPVSGAVVLLALAVANVALLARHFLLRYVALEIAALCVALAPLIELRGQAGSQLTWSVYLFLRLGDAGLLVAVLILTTTSGTLDIGATLQAGQTADPRFVSWALVGLLLAIWVKLGGLPFHLWKLTSRDLAPSTQAWLYALLMPSLGLYLLYRVTPLLVASGSLKTLALWLGAIGAATAAFMALTQADARTALVYAGAAQGGLFLFTAASGVKLVGWLGTLALTPILLLLHLAVDMVQTVHSPVQRKAIASTFALGGAAMVAFGLLITWWARQAGAPLDALFVAEIAVALSGVWTVRTVRQFARPLGEAAGRPAAVWTQWMTLWLLGGIVLAGVLAPGPLARHLATAGQGTLPALPMPLTLLRYLTTAPALLLMMALVLAVWQLQKRSRWGSLVPARPVEAAYNLEGGLAWAAQVLHAVVEVGILEQIVSVVVRVVVDGAQLAYRVVEQEGLEGLLRRSVQAVLALNSRLQRWHSGKLRYNLLWVAVSLALALLALMLYV